MPLHFRACQAAARSSHLQGRDCRYQRTQEPAARCVRWGSRNYAVAAPLQDSTGSSARVRSAKLDRLIILHAHTLPDPSAPIRLQLPPLKLNPATMSAAPHPGQPRGTTEALRAATLLPFGLG